MVRAILLLVASNVFMTIAWYGHLRYQNVPLWKVVLISWMIAFVEYCFMVPAFQLKMIQEVITLVVFGVFAVAYLKEPFHWKYILSFILLLGAVYFMFKK